MTFAQVAGTCPACGSRGTLFVGDGGYITCSLDRCPDPGVVADLLDRPNYHVVEVDENGCWSLQHAVTCFPNLLDCWAHHALVQGALFIATPGRYRLHDDVTYARMVDARGQQ